MLKYKKWLSILLATVISFPIGVPSLADNTSADGIPNVLPPQAQYTKKEYPPLGKKLITELDTSAISDTLPEGYDQNIIDDINNNSIRETNEMEASPAINGIPDDSLPLTAAATSEMVGDEFQIEPISSPFHMQNSENEFVSLATGDMVYKTSLLSLPGRNGLDLDISVRYHSGDAAITKNEFEISNTYDTGQNFNRFAIGWSFGFSTIVKGRQFYGYNSPLALTLSSGESYEIQGDYETLTQDNALTLKNYKLSDLSLIRKADTKEYVLTYSDGKKEYFDGTYGYITKIEDRFNNSILFEYSDIEYFRGTFIDYIFNPSFYVSTLKALSKITDSMGRVIEFDYNVSSVLEGKTIKNILLKMNNTIYATITLDNVSCYNGKIDILKEISDAEGYKTKFTYEEKIAHILAQGQNDYLFNGSVFLLKQINFPTGGYSAYEYEKARRSYTYFNPPNVLSSWFEVFKVCKRNDSSGYAIEYQYENDRSGYPYSYLKNMYPTDNTGEIQDKNMQYSTIVTDGDKVTIHTFNYQHNQISQQVYDKMYSVSSYFPAKGKAQWQGVIGNQLYRLEEISNILAVYRVNSNGTTSILTPYTKGLPVGCVKTKGNLIYVFYKSRRSVNDPYFVGAKAFNVAKNEWSDEGEWQLPENIKSCNITKMYYTGEKFVTTYTTSSQIHHIVYDPSKKDINSRWEVKTVSFNLSSYSLTHLCIQGNDIYYTHRGKICKYNLTSNTIESKTISGISVSEGFAVNNKLYIVSNKRIYEFLFDSGTTGEVYDFPSSYSGPGFIWRVSDGSVCYIASEKDENNLYGIYKWNPSNKETPWQLATYRLFEHTKNTNIVMGYQAVYMSIYQKYDSITESGFEKIDLTPNLNTKSRYRIDMNYNANGLMTARKTIIFDKETYKTESTENWDYLSGKSILTSHTDKLGNTTKYEYANSAYYIPTKVRQYADTENELVTDYALSADQKVVLNAATAYDDRNQITSYTYDSVYPGNPVTQTDKVQKGENVTVLNAIQNTYDANGGFVTSVTVKNVVTNGKDYTLTSPANIVTARKTYNDLGLLASETDANGNTTSYTYYKNGWLRKIVNPDGSFVEHIYSISPDSSKLTTSYNDQYCKVDYYDGLGRVIKQAEKDGINGTETMLQEYTYRGKYLQLVTLADGYHTWYSVDAFGRVFSYYIFMEFLTEGNYIGYDDYNRTVTEQTGYFGGDSQTKVSHYDVANRKIKTELMETFAGTSTVTYDYDYRGKIYQSTDANLNVTHFEYDDIGNLLRTTDAAGQWTAYEYDDKGNTTKVTTCGGNSVSYQYDSLNRVIKQTDAMGQSEYCRYDNNGNLLGTKDKKRQYTNYVYDCMNRVTNLSSGGLSVSNTYDLMGNKTKMADEHGETNYTYKYNNLLESVTTPDNKSISYGYDVLGNLISVNDYNGNHFTYSYDYNNNNRKHVLKQIKKGAATIASYEYNELGSVRKATYPEGTEEYTFNSAGQVLSLTNKLANGSVLNQYSYEYDILGNQTKKTETVGSNTYVTEYEYDMLSRLTSETAPDGTKAEYTFDKNNNIQTKKMTHPASAAFSFRQDNTSYTISNLSTHEINYAYNANNQLLQQREFLAGTSENYSGFLEVVKDYDYDANGNTIRQTTSGQVDESVVEYTYNPWNQLTQYKGADGSVATYTYDGTGMRTSKTCNDVTTKFYWDRGYISNEAVDGAFTANNYIGAQGIFARESGDTTSYMFKNGHGDVVKLVSDGAVTQNYDFDAYGSQKGEPSTTDNNPFRYCGEYFDQESGLIYLRARYYDPSTGRFITEDPAKDGLNWYGYCANDPVNRLDITGKEWGYIRDFMRDLSVLFPSNTTSYTSGYNPNIGGYTYAHIGEGNLWAGGVFYYNGAAEMNNLNSHGRKTTRVIGENVGGRLYMDRRDFYDAMGIKYAEHTSSEYYVSKFDNAVNSFLVGVTVGLIIPGTGVLQIVISGAVSTIVTTAFSPDSGYFKAEQTIALVWNEMFKRYDSITTVSVFYRHPSYENYANEAIFTETYYTGDWYARNGVTSDF